MTEPLPGDPTGWGAPAGPHSPFPPAAWAKPQLSTSALVALVLGGLSLVFPILPAFVALILARNADEEIAASGGRVTGTGLANAGRAMAKAGLALWTVILVVVAGVVVLTDALI